MYKTIDRCSGVMAPHYDSRLDIVLEMLLLLLFSYFSAMYVGA